MIEVVKVKNRDEGNLKAYEILKKIVDSQTVLALSGGTSPDYKKILGRNISPGAICVVDERYGKPYHADSNELLLKKMGVEEFARKSGVEFNKILTGGDFLETARKYNQVIARLFNKFPKKAGVVGIGANLHTAGIFPYTLAAKSPDLVVAEIVPNKFPKRITLTLKALGEFQNFVILVFGEAKREALEILLDEGENDMQKYPAIFYRKSFARSYLITDIPV